MRASEIKNMKFKQKISGYGKTEVDDYLNKVRVSMQKLEDQNKSLQDQLNEANKEVDAAHRKEATVNRSIFVAQEAADRLREEALNEAALIVERAEEEARRLLAEAAEKAAVINTETDNLQEAARTYLHQSFGMILQAKDMYEDPRWENLFFENPVGDVPTPQFDEVVKDYDLPVRSNKGEAIFEAAAEKAEKEQRKEEFFNNDIPAIAPVFSGFKDNEPVVEEAETSAVAENTSESVETASSENTGSENTPDAAEESQAVAAETTDQTDTNQPTTDAEDVTDELVQSESTEAELTNPADKSEE